jgi:hypothetical protein
MRGTGKNWWSRRMKENRQEKEKERKGGTKRIRIKRRRGDRRVRIWRVSR